MSIHDVVRELEAERDRLQAAIDALRGLDNTGRRGKHRRKMSLAARRKIAAAQRARWAKQKKTAKTQ